MSAVTRRISWLIAVVFLASFLTYVSSMCLKSTRIEALRVKCLNNLAAIAEISRTYSSIHAGRHTINDLYQYANDRSVFLCPQSGKQYISFTHPDPDAILPCDTILWCPACRAFLFKDGHVLLENYNDGTGAPPINVNSEDGASAAGASAGGLKPAAEDREAQADNPNDTDKTIPSSDGIAGGTDVHVGVMESQEEPQQDKQ